MTDASEQWGPWIEHSGDGCPCVGMWVMTEHVCVLRGSIFYGAELAKGGQSWYWVNYPDYTKVIRYRIRKPRGMEVLQSLLENLPERVDA